MASESSAELDAAIASLFQSPFGEFVAVRKRLAAELKLQGNAEAARQLTALKRPPLSAWVVNQLYWRDGEVFSALFEAAKRLGSGDLGEAATHRRLLSELRARGAELLTLQGHPASEQTLRRVHATLSALAAAGSFAPDPAGALQGDREPPGFDAMSLPLATGERAAGEARASDAAADAREQARALAEEQHRLEERARREAERAALALELDRAEQALELHEDTATRLREELALAERSAREARAKKNEIEARLKALS